jgi:branched-chain amino acid transport system permease protein
VTVGIRSNVAALLAGIAFAMAPGLFIDYLPQSLAQLPTVLFGLGAVLVAKYPEGTLTMHARAARSFAARLVRQPSPPAMTTTVAGGGT